MLIDIHGHCLKNKDLPYRRGDEPCVRMYDKRPADEIGERFVDGDHAALVKFGLEVGGVA